MSSRLTFTLTIVAAVLLTCTHAATNSRYQGLLHKISSRIAHSATDLKECQFGKGISKPVETPLLKRLILRKRYALTGSSWAERALKYRIDSYSRKLQKKTVEMIIRKSFKVWEEHSALNFEFTQGDTAHIILKFAEYDHGDKYPFDGPGNVMGHSFYPNEGGQVHFDDSESWDTSGSSDLYSVASHEIGHALGLQHSQDPTAIMHRYYKKNHGETIHLAQDDIQAVQYLYGRRGSSPPEGTVPTTTLPTSDTVRSLSEGASFNDVLLFDICSDPTLDAITVLGNRSAFAFKGDYYWRMNDISFDSGYPRKISDDWQGLEGRLDAALTDTEGDTYFFKGDQYWQYDRYGSRKPGFPKSISENLASDTPNNLDAATLHGYNDRPYFFKGSNYWQYDSAKTTSPPPAREIRTISQGLSGRIDAAVKWLNGNTYLFSGTQYYRLLHGSVLTVAPGYPRSIGEWWFGCRSAESEPADYSDK